MAGTSEDDFRAFATASGPRLGRVAYLLMGDRGEAEDLVQIVLARTWVSWFRLHDPVNAEAYARTVLVRAASKAWKRRPPVPTAVDLHAVAEDPSGRWVVADAVRGALAQLPPAQRAVLVLRYYEQMSETEIAQLLRCSPGTVKSRASRALAQLRASGLLDEDLIQDPSHRSEVSSGHR